MTTPVSMTTASTMGSTMLKDNGGNSFDERKRMRAIVGAVAITKPQRRHSSIFGGANTKPLRG